MHDIVKNVSSDIDTSVNAKGKIKLPFEVIHKIYIEAHLNHI